jgi:TetR/AcrR family transcriptional regulator
MVKPTGQNDADTRVRILAAARVVFHRAGFDGARTQDIADAAGINKALLHYYFRTKDQLFESVFEDAFQTHFAPVFKMMSVPDAPLDTTIHRFTEAYIDTLLEHPYLPGFVIHELNRNPQRLVDLALDAGRSGFSAVFDQLRQGMASGIYRTADPRQLMVTLMGMVLYPFIARPILSALMQLDEHAYPDFIRYRKDEIPRQFFALLQP